MRAKDKSQNPKTLLLGAKESTSSWRSWVIQTLLGVLNTIPIGFGYGIQNFPNKFNMANSSGINVVLINQYIFEIYRETFPLIMNGFNFSYNFRFLLKATGLILLFLASAGGSLSAFQGIKYSSNAYLPEKMLPIADFLNYGFLILNTLLYLYPLSFDMNRLFNFFSPENKNIENKKLSEAIDFILKSIEKAQATEDPEKIKAIKGIIEQVKNLKSIITAIEENVQNNRQLTEEDRQAFEDLKKNITEIFYLNMTEGQKSREEDSMPKKAFDTLLTLVSTGGMVAVLIGSLTALLPATTAGYKYVFGEFGSGNDWFMMFMNSTQAYFSGKSFSLMLKYQIDLLKKIFSRCKIKEKKPEEWGASIIPVLFAIICFYLAFRSVSTVSNQLDSASIRIDGDWIKQPVSHLLTASPVVKKVASNLATLGAGSANLYSIASFVEKYSDQFRAIGWPTKTDNHIKNLDIDHFVKNLKMVLLLNEKITLLPPKDTAPENHTVDISPEPKAEKPSYFRQCTTWLSSYLSFSKKEEENMPLLNR